MKKVSLLAILAAFALTSNVESATLFQLMSSDGKALYSGCCAKCHGKDGKGHTRTGSRLGCKDYTDPSVQSAFSDEQALNFFKESSNSGADSKIRELHSRAVVQLSDDQIKAAIAYLRTFNSNPVQSGQGQQNVTLHARSDAAPETVAAEDPASALERARVTVQQDPSNWRAFHGLGLAYYKMARYSDAVNAYQQAISLYPITAELDADRKQQMASEAALNAQREAVRAAEAQQSQQKMNQFLSMATGMMGARIPNFGTAFNTTMGLVQQSQQFETPAPNALSPSPQATGESRLKSQQDLAWLYADLGAAQRGMEAYSDAIKSFEQVSSLDPSRTDANKWIGLCNYSLGNYGNCISYTSRYLTFASGDDAIECLLTMSRAFRDVGLPSEAQTCFSDSIAELQRRINQDPGNAAPILKLAQAFLDSDQWDKALDLYRKALVLKQNDPGILMNIAQCQFALELYPDAKSTLASVRPLVGTQTTQLNETHFWYLMGRLTDALNLPDQAQDAYRHCVASAESSSDKPPTFVVVAYAGIGQNERAVQMLMDSLAQNGGRPESFGDWFRLALVQDKANNPIEGVEALDHCMEFRPRYPFALTLQKEFITKNETEIEEALSKSKAAEDNQNPVEAIKQLGHAYALTPSGTKKQELQQRLLKIVGELHQPIPIAPEAQRYFYRANAILKDAKGPNDVDLAIIEYRRALAYSPWSPEIYLSLGVAYGTSFRFKDAEEQLKLFLAANPNAQNSDEVLQRLYELEVEHEQAMRSLSALCPQKSELLPDASNVPNRSNNISSDDEPKNPPVSSQATQGISGQQSVKERTTK